MIGRLLSILFALFAAVAGALLGRMVADMRRQSESNEQMQFNADLASMRPRDVMPGIVAALRVKDRPWSYMHIPSWVAAFSVNFAFAALAHEMGPLLGALRGDSDDRRYADDSSAWPTPPAYTSSAGAEPEARPF